ncbi:TetR/AcrR family transcriptional regulator [uncultured Boseongicola sp.]|jgi:AcrR family transcriptional regulator|uniref:TetR/AcrR family transcriptional regulator n=1 Tax=uncultured Boseongicola sp. TaxID=1648499 RepID=UPI00260CAE04|nr:TetR/AcrR family transcriptional regulator [uncultured Boseongicola sp.]
MAHDTTKRREALRTTLTELAEAHVRADGLASLRARTLATEAGCAVGAIYNVFDDMTGLTLAVNGRTFRRLGTHVSDAVAKVADTTPTERLVAMAVAYLEFAIANPNLWRALFDVEMSSDRDVPAWYLEELGRLFAIIAGPLSELHPDPAPGEIDLMTRALFSSVHGIVLLGLENRISAVPRERLEGMIEFLLHRVTAT